MSRSYLFAHPEDVLDDAAFARFDALLQRRLDGEPMAYITGTREFWSHELLVSPATLVPRPETELLVDLALREIPRKAVWQILDLGTGSGAIAIAIASERLIVRGNRDRPQRGRARCCQGECPPAVARQHQLCRRAAGPSRAGPAIRPDRVEPALCARRRPGLAELRFEPVDALRSGSDGLDAIRALAADCAES